jgi:hypothetical protein
MTSSTSIDHPESRQWNDKRTLVQSVTLGAAYGVLLRVGLFNIEVRHWLDAHILPQTGAVMTIAFLVLGPLIIGFLTIRHTEARGPAPIWIWFLLPWVSVSLMLVTTLLFMLEGLICILMALPIALVLASIGGVIAGVIGRKLRVNNTSTFCIALLPFILAPAEARLNAPTSTRTVASEIRIHSSTATVWQNIERVPAISPAELRPNWTHRIGFPRPVEATLSFEGVGGIRHASFERGLLFIETVTAWEPDHRLAFTIKADSAHIPTTTLDEHVTIGGRYFDVLDGEYRIEPLAGGDILLHLTSHQRLSTDFNGYAGLWTDAVMQSLQTSILQVIQHRCEHP